MRTVALDWIPAPGFQAEHNGAGFFSGRDGLHNLALLGAACNVALLSSRFDIVDGNSSSNFCQIILT